MGAVGALAPTVFLPCPEITHISVPSFLPSPEVVLILSPTLFTPVWRQWWKTFFEVTQDFEANSALARGIVLPK